MGVDEPYHDENNPPLANHGPEGFAPPSPPVSPANDEEATMLLEPVTQPITQGQLINEVKGIYAGLVMVEKKCVEVPSSLSAPHPLNKLQTRFAQVDQQPPSSAS